MARYLLLKLSSVIPLAIGLSLFAFLVIHAVDGDAVFAFLGEDADAQQIEVYRERFGLDRPLPIQYLDWAAGVVTGDFGRAPLNGADVGATILRRLPPTVELMVLAVGLSVVVGIPLGTLAATKRNSARDIAISTFALTGYSLPAFVMGIMMIWLFAVYLGWLPPSGFVPFREDPVENLKGMILPSVTLASSLTPVIIRQTRSSMLEVLGQDYIRTAHAKGLSYQRVLISHAMRNALIPVVTVIGVMTSRLLGGSVLVEVVFAVPGIGSLAAEAILQRDLITVKGVILMMAFAVIFVDVVVDAIYAWLDPRIRYA